MLMNPHKADDLIENEPEQTQAEDAETDDAGNRAATCPSPEQKLRVAVSVRTRAED
jgi:hypothetical protein